MPGYSDADGAQQFRAGSTVAPATRALNDQPAGMACDRNWGKPFPDMRVAGGAAVSSLR